jgi:putative SOS response-associated peptidase YedK
MQTEQMCNLYSLTKNQDAIRRLFGVAKDSAGNLPPLPGIFPNYLAPVVRGSPDGRELIMMHWGMPNPPRSGGTTPTSATLRRRIGDVG